MASQALLFLLSLTFCSVHAAPVENTLQPSQVPASAVPSLQPLPFGLDYQCSISHFAADQKTLIQNYKGLCTGDAECGDSFNGVNLRSEGCSKDGSKQCCVHEQKIACAGKYSAYQCLNSRRQPDACEKGTWVKFSYPSENPCPGSQDDDVKCCIPPETPFPSSSTSFPAEFQVVNVLFGDDYYNNNNNNAIIDDGPYDENAPTSNFPKEPTTEEQQTPAPPSELKQQQAISRFETPLPVGGQGFQRYGWD